MNNRSLFLAVLAFSGIFVFKPAFAAEEATLLSDGFIRHWLVLAPIQLESDADGALVINKSQVPDEGMLKPKAGDKIKVSGKELTWKKVKSTDYFLDLNSMLNQQTEKTIGYAVTYVKSEEEQSHLQLKMGSNDQGKVYLNGEVLLKTSEPRPLEQDADVASNVTLKKGVNVVVFKIFNEGGSDWQGCLRFATSKGKPINNLIIQSEP
jgi:hypothetical protein